VLKKWSIPVYGPEDQKNAEDQAFHEHINKLFDRRLQKAQCANFPQSYGVEINSSTMQEFDETDDDEPRVKKKKSYKPERSTKKQVKPKKKKLVEPLEPQECLTLQSLVKFCLHSARSYVKEMCIFFR
jgi:hypothetical protein